MLGTSFCHHVSPREVDIKQAAKHGNILFNRRFSLIGDAGAIHQNVDVTVLFYHCLNNVINLIFVGYIATDTKVLNAQLTGNRKRGRLIQIGNNHNTSLFSKGMRASQSQAAGSSGNQDNFGCEF